MDHQTEIEKPSPSPQKINKRIKGIRGRTLASMSVFLFGLILSFIIFSLLNQRFKNEA
jgi:hypothetical protein